MRIRPQASFQRDFKRLLKKYPSLNSDIRELGNSLRGNPHQGDALGDNCYKVRLLIRSKNTGKSGGGRVITYLKIERESIYLLAIYDKSEMESLPDAFIKQLVKKVEDDLENE